MCCSDPNDQIGDRNATRPRELHLEPTECVCRLLASLDLLNGFLLPKGSFESSLLLMLYFWRQHASEIFTDEDRAFATLHASCRRFSRLTILELT